MPAVLQPKQPAVTPATPAAAAAAPPAAADSTPAPAKAWGGDRIALFVWLTGAAIMAVILFKDLVVALVSR
jgi:hypothetical protein